MWPPWETADTAYECSKPTSCWTNANHESAITTVDKLGVHWNLMYTWPLTPKSQPCRASYDRTS